MGGNISPFVIERFALENRLLMRTAPAALRHAAICVIAITYPCDTAYKNENWACSLAIL